MLHIILHFSKIINNKNKSPFYSPFFYYFTTLFILLSIVLYLKIQDIKTHNNQNATTYINTIPYNTNTKFNTHNKNQLDLTQISENTPLANKKGKVYYFINCLPKTIKKENLITYKSPLEAQKAGKTLSKSCKGK